LEDAVCAAAPVIFEWSCKKGYAIIKLIGGGDSDRKRAMASRAARDKWGA